MDRAYSPDTKRAESFPDTSDPVLFPQLSADQLALVAEFATRREYAASEFLFDQGVRDAPLFVLTSGSIDIIDRRPDGDLCINTAGSGNFVGDIAMFTGEPTVVAGVATEPTAALLVDRESLRRLVSQHSGVGDLLLRTFMARRAWLEGQGYGQVTLIGPQRSQETFRLREFLSRNEVPFRWYDPEADDKSKTLLDALHIDAAGTPVLIDGGGEVARNPDLGAMADRMGLRVAADGGTYDLVVVGAGPAGLAAAVYAASEGLRTFVVDGRWPGGQAGTSSKIENYLGFLTGVSGADLTRQAVLQARKFGATLSSPRAARRLEDRGDTKVVELDDGTRVEARCVLVASGADYRRLDCRSCEAYEGRGVYYAASQVESGGCGGREVVIVGAGNSAGQATVFLASKAAKVYLAVRGGGLAEAKMSHYLSDRIAHTANVEVLPRTWVESLHGDGQLTAVGLRADDGTVRRVETESLFVMIGADPRTAWLDGAVLMDGHGFLLTGDELRHDARLAGCWPLDRDPYLLETSVLGVFAAGDARLGSVKRVASAVGEGAMSVTFTNRRLAELAAADGKSNRLPADTR